MKYIEFDSDKKLDLILLGRVAIDFNPVDYYKTLAESSVFKKYVGGSPANIAVGLSRLNKKCGFISRVSDDRFGDYVLEYFRKGGIDTSHIGRCEHGEKTGLTVTEAVSSMGCSRAGISWIAWNGAPLQQPCWYPAMDARMTCRHFTQLMRL